MNKKLKILSPILCGVLLSTSFGISNVFAKSNESINTSKTIVNEINLNTKNEHIVINKNREVFVNGKNITTITPLKLNTKNYSTLLNRASYDQWTYSGQNEYKYDLAGVSLVGALKICNRLGLSTTLNALKSLGAPYLINGMFSTGVYIRDVRSIYYKNINKWRPDMKEVHSFYFVAEVTNIGKYEKYIGGFTTYGGI